jgi:hypothetical protein
MTKVNFDVLNKAFESAPMTETKTVQEETEYKKKLINMPVDWEKKIKNSYKGTLNSYILMSIYERMQKDEII